MRFSLSSGKSYQNGLCVTPGQPACVNTCPCTKEVILNDDIEKRVLINKDGSLSVEMKVRFRLVSDETLHWSTEIKKSTATLNKCSPLKEGDPHYFKAKPEFSDLESSSAHEVEEGEEDFSPKHLDESYCANCQEYDIWKNPMYNGGRKSPGFSSSACKIMHKKASVESVRTPSRSSEGFTEHVVEKASCFQKTAIEREKRVQYCSVNHCCSEVSTTPAKMRRTTEGTCESDAGCKCLSDADTKPNTVDFHDSLCDPESSKVPKKYHSDSAVSDSSQVFESLKEGWCDDDDLPSIAQGACAWCQGEKPGQFVHCKISQASENICLSPRPPTSASNCSALSSKHKKYRNVHPSQEMPHQLKDHANTYRTDSARSIASKVSSRSQSCRCGETLPRLMASGMHISFGESTQVVMCRGNKVCNESRARTNCPGTSESDVYGAEEVRAGERECDDSFMSTMSANTGVLSGQFRKSTVYPCCSGCKNADTAESGLSEDARHTQAQENEDVEVKSPGVRSPRSHKSNAFANHTRCVPQIASPVSDLLKNGIQNYGADTADTQGKCTESILFVLSKQCNNSDQTTRGRSSDAESMCFENAEVTNIEKKPESARSVESYTSAKSNTNRTVKDGVSTLGQDLGETSTKQMTSQDVEENDGPVLSANKTQSGHMFQELILECAMSTKSNSSSKSAKSQHTNIPSPIEPDKTYNLVPGESKKEKAVNILADSSKTCTALNTLRKKQNKIQQNTTQRELGETENAATQTSETEGKVLKAHCLEISYRSHKVNNNIPDTVSPRRSSKCHCSSYQELIEANSNNHDGCLRTMASDLKSEKSPIACLHGQLGELLSPTSTASISLELNEEDKCEHLSEESISSMSHNVDEEKCPAEIMIPKPDASDCALNSSDKAIKASGMNSALSENTKKSFVSQDHCMNTKQVFSLTSATKSGSILSTKSKAENMTDSQLNDSRCALPSGWSGSSDVSCDKSSCRASKPSKNNSFIKNSKGATQAVDGSQDGDKSEIDKASAILERFSKLSQNKIVSGKGTATNLAKCKDQCAKKIKKGSFSDLEINGSGTSLIQSVKPSKAGKRAQKKGEQTSRTNAGAVTDVSHNGKVLNKNTMPTILLGSSSDSVLSHTRSAVDLLGEKSGNSAPENRSNTFEETKNCLKCEKSSRYKKRGKSLLSQKNRDQGLELMPSNLPNASPVEVVNDWLKKIPVDGPMFDMGDELNVHSEAVPVNADESLHKEIRGMSEDLIKIKEFQGSAGNVTVKQDVSAIHEETLTCNKKSHTVAASNNSSAPEKLAKREILPTRCQSSVQVMKVLLSPKLDRCNSLPEVSPTYGKKLSTSAKDLLDCLINQQLINSKNDKDDKYDEILSIFQSLWFSDPSESEQDKHRIKDNGLADDEFNPRSSSGIDVSSGSLGSVRVSVYGGVQKSDTAQGRIAPIAEQEPSLLIHENTGKKGVHDSGTPGNAEVSYPTSQPVTPDIAERVRCSPEVEETNGEQPEDEEGLHGEDMIQSENQQKRKKMDTTFCKKCCRNYSNTLNPVVYKEMDQLGNANSGTCPSVQRGAFTKSISQDPDPVWVLSLLKKIEKQFMSHYANAVEEFKVKWDLTDNEMLDTIIRDVKEEVHKRIQSSINREFQKIQSRAGRTPKPLISSLSRDFTAQTDQRRRLLKVMRKKSVLPSPVCGAEFSEQRSEDEYCPCNTCVRKKTAVRTVQHIEAQRLPPVVVDFDLRRILQTKQLIPVRRPTESMQEDPIKETANCFRVQEKGNLDVLGEEPEVHRDMKRRADDFGKAEEEVRYSADADEHLTEDAAAASEIQSADVGVNNDGGEAGEEERLDDGKGAEEERSTGPAAGERREEGEIETGRGSAEDGKAEEGKGVHDQGKGSKDKEGEAKRSETAMRGGGEGEEEAEEDQDPLDKESGVVEGGEQECEGETTDEGEREEEKTKHRE
ncbi:uncharacterized protein rp1l1a isoform X2 [Brachyhypopomus gauderio]